jgi:GTPase
MGSIIKIRELRFPRWFGNCGKSVCHILAFRQEASFEPITSATIIPTDTADLKIYSQYEAENIQLNQYIYGQERYCCNNLRISH